MIGTVATAVPVGDEIKGNVCFQIRDEVVILVSGVVLLSVVCMGESHRAAGRG